MQRTESNQSRHSRKPNIDNKKDKLHAPTHIKDNNYIKYYFTNKGIVSIKSNEEKVAISELEWMILCEGTNNTEWKWFTLTLSFCLSLLFSSVCLIGTTTYQQGGKVLWLPLLATVVHIAGCVASGLLSIYFWQKKRNTKQDPIYKLLKKRIDNKFAVNSDALSSPP